MSRHRSPTSRIGRTVTPSSDSPALAAGKPHRTAGGAGTVVAGRRLGGAGACQGLWR
jgi:hypothetical protein